MYLLRSDTFNETTGKFIGANCKQRLCIANERDWYFV